MVDIIRLGTSDARVLGQLVLDIATNVLVNSMERTVAGPNGASRALAVSNTSRWVLQPHRTK